MHIFLDSYVHFKKSKWNISYKLRICVFVYMQILIYCQDTWLLFIMKYLQFCVLWCLHWLSSAIVRRVMNNITVPQFHCSGFRALAIFRVTLNFPSTHIYVGRLVHPYKSMALKKYINRSNQTNFSTLSLCIENFWQN